MSSPTQTRWPSQRKLSAIYGMALGLLVANVLFMVWNLYAISDASREVRWSHETIVRLEDIRSELLKAEIAEVEFVYSGKERNLTQFNRSVAKVRNSLKALSGRLHDNPTRRSYLLAVERAIAAETAEIGGVIGARKAGAPVAILDDQLQGRMDRVERRIDAMEMAETEYRKSKQDENNDLFWSAIYAFVAASALDLVLLLGVHYLSYRSRRELTLNAEWFSTTLRNIGDAVIATDASGRISFMNGVAEELTGWGEPEAAGRPLEDVFVILEEMTREPAISPVGRVIATGAIQGLVDHTILISRGGLERPINDSAAPIKNPDGMIQGVVMVFRDVTQDRLASAERERFYRELGERDRRKDEFLAMLAHELRNPLAAIGYAVMLSSQFDTREHLDLSLDVIRRQMRHLSRLIDDLLDVSRISRGKIALKQDRIDAGASLVNAIETVRPLIDERGQSLEVSIEPGGLPIDADPTRLEQIFVNLLNNAAKYTDNGGKIKVVGRKEDHLITVVISDTGIGIAPENLSQMFELFVQGDRSLARSEGGLGIGLTVVKKLVEMHGGSVTARSEGIGKGSEFTIRLPAAGYSEDGDSAPRPALRVPGPTRVLVVDDNVDTVHNLSKFLKILGLEVEVAYNGHEAIEKARRSQPDYILLDLILPGMDGYEVARYLRKETSCRDAVIIAITGGSGDADRKRCEASGIDHHMLKPLDQDILVTLLSKS